MSENAPLPELGMEEGPCRTCSNRPIGTEVDLLLIGILKGIYRVP